MKLATLIEYKRCFDMLQQHEEKRERLTSQQYLECFRANSDFSFELKEHLRDMTAQVDETGK